MAAFHGPTPVPEAIAHCQEILGQRLGDRRLEGILMRLLAPLHAMVGDFDEARALYGRARATFDDVGATILTATVSLDAALVEMLAGNPEAAERELRRDYEVLERLRETYIRPTVAAFLARVLLAQGRSDEAEPFAATAEEVAADDDLISQALWRSVRASLLASGGRFEDAVEVANAAVGLLRATDGVLKQADALVVVAEVLMMAARVAEPALVDRHAAAGSRGGQVGRLREEVAAALPGDRHAVVEDRDAVLGRPGRQRPGVEDLEVDGRDARGLDRDLLAEAGRRPGRAVDLVERGVLRV